MTSWLVIQLIPDLVNDIITWILTLIQDVSDMVKTWLSDLLQTFIDKTLEIIDTISSWVLDMIKKFQELKDKVMEQIEFWWRDMITKVEEKALEIVGQIDGMVADLIAIIVNAKTEFITAGANIIDGVIEGISGKLADAQAAVLGVASDLKGAWDSFWNSQSPSRLMMESGVDIMKGVELGVEKQAPILDSVLTGAGQAAFGGFIGSVQNVLPTAPAPIVTNTQSSVENNFNVENSFAGQPQITDADQLRFALTGLTS